jgi:hypothetical protein
LQEAVLKQAIILKQDKLAVSTKEVEQLKEQLQSNDKEWQARLRAETNKWQATLEEHLQDVETEQAKMAEAVAGIVFLLL